MAGACGARFSEGDRLVSFVLRAAACSAAFLPLGPSSVSDGLTRPMAADEVTCLVFSARCGAVLFDARFRKRRKVNVAHHISRSAAACDVSLGQKLRVGVFYSVARNIQAFGELANGHEFFARFERVLGDVASNGIVNLHVKRVSRVLVKRNHRRHPLAD